MSGYNDYSSDDSCLYEQVVGKKSDAEQKLSNKFIKSSDIPVELDIESTVDSIPIHTFHNKCGPAIPKNRNVSKRGLSSPSPKNNYLAGLSVCSACNKIMRYVYPLNGVLTNRLRCLFCNGVCKNITLVPDSIMIEDMLSQVYSHVLARYTCRACGFMLHMPNQIGRKVISPCQRCGNSKNISIEMINVNRHNTIPKKDDNKDNRIISIW